MTMSDVASDVEFRGLSGPQLVEAYNEMLATWVDLGGDNRYGTVRRFSTLEAGQRRCRELHEAVVERRASMPQPETVVGRSPPTQPMSPERPRRGRPLSPRVPVEGDRPLRAYTEEYNALVPRANELGITWARVHSSLFESKAKAAAQLERLRQAIAGAERAR